MKNVYQIIQNPVTQNTPKYMQFTKIYQNSETQSAKMGQN